MIAWLEGKIIKVAPAFVVVENNGIGYKVYTPKSDFKINSRVRFFIYHHILENRNDLYGFEKEDDLAAFEMLISVSGVGPKLALAVLAGAGSKAIVEAVKTGSTEIFHAISGVGPKLAAKIVVELKNKTDEAFNLGSLAAGSEVIDGLKALGYTQKEINRGLKNMPSKLKSSQEKISWVLRNFGKNSH